MGSTPRPSASTTRPSEGGSHRQPGLPLQGSLPQQVVDRVFCPPRHDAPVSVAEHEQLGTRADACFGEDPERELHTAGLVDVEFCGFSDHLGQFATRSTLTA